jgi:hypothetical protein
MTPTGVVSSLSPLRCRLSSCRCRHVAASCHTSFPWSQDKLVASASSYGNTLSYCLPSRTEIEALNLHHRRGPPSSDRSTPTLHCYKKVISTLPTLHHSTTSPFCLLPSQSITPSELHPLLSSPFTTVSYSSSLCTMRPTVMN